jgi:hypothetical protein
MQAPRSLSAPGRRIYWSFEIKGMDLPESKRSNSWQCYPFQTYLPQGQETVSAGFFFSKGF